jgi:hypothetical protein
MVKGIEVADCVVSIVFNDLTVADRGMLEMFLKRQNMQQDLSVYLLSKAVADDDVKHRGVLNM